MTTVDSIVKTTNTSNDDDWFLCRAFAKAISAERIFQILEKLSASNSKIYSFQEIKSDFETHLEDFELFWYSKPVNTLREFGLLIL